MNDVSVTITRKPEEVWIPVWYTPGFGPWRERKRIRAIAGNPSRTGKTVRVKFWSSYAGCQMDRMVSPKNLEPRNTDSGDAKQL